MGINKKILTLAVTTSLITSFMSPVLTFAAETLDTQIGEEETVNNQEEEEVAEESTTSSIEEETSSVEDTSSSEEETEPTQTEPTDTSSTEATEPTESQEDSSTVESTETTTDTSEVKTSESKTTTSISETKTSTDSSEIKTETSKEKDKTDGNWGNVASVEETTNYSLTSDIAYIKNQTTEAFIESIGDKAREIGQEYDLYASVMIAQAILETGSGNSQLSQEPYHNLFGIKGAYKGDSVSFSTSEDNGKGGLYLIQASFRKYPGYKESFEDYAELLTSKKNGNGEFYQGTWKKNTKDYRDATKALTGKYATDTSYDQKLNSLIKAYDLTFFDQKLAGDAKIQNIYYDVKKTETVVSVIKDHHIAEEDFVKWNQKALDKNRELIEGQRVIIGQRKMTTFNVKNIVTKKESQFIVPLKSGYVVSSPFGNREGEHHNGIDLAVPADTIIYASSKGKVVAKGFDPSAGNYVILLHENGLYTSYFHMNRSAVSLDEKVDMGDMIGYVGSTGNSTGPHLHFAINSEPWSGYFNPSNYLDF